MAIEIFEPMRFTIDLDTGLVTKPQRTQLNYGDANANRIIVRVIKNKQSVDLSGVSATGSFYRPGDRAQIALNGEVSGSEASVTLIDHCYAVEGEYEAEVKLIHDGVTRTILSITGYVHKAGSGAVVDVSGVIPSLDELLAQIEAMKTAIANTNTATSKANAAADNANAKAQEADEAADAANAWADATASAVSVEPNEEADVDVETDEDGTKHLGFKIPRGQPGVQVSDTEPTDPKVNVWIKPDGGVDENGTVVDLGSVYERINTKADAVIDVSSRAASHTLHAQRGPLAVTLFGKTTETGSGDKSPDNPYEISGIETAQIVASGRNLARANGKYAQFGITITQSEDGGYIFTGTNNGNGNTSAYFTIAPITHLHAGTQYAFSLHCSVTDVNLTLQYKTPGGSTKYKNMKSAIITPDEDWEVLAIYAEVSKGNTYAFSNVKANVQVEVGSTATAYEPYTANVINPPLLPDGSPLHGNGTVDDTVENWAPSGCDKFVVIDGSDDENIYTASDGRLICDGIIPDGTPINADNQSTLMAAFCDRYAPLTWVEMNTGSRPGVCIRYGSGRAIDIRDSNIKTFADWKTALAANPLTVYYRSINYTPDKDLMVCRTHRRFKTIEFDGTENWILSSGFFALSVINALNKYDDAIQYSNMYAYSKGNLGDKEFGISNILYVSDNDYADIDAWKQHLSSLITAGTPLAVTYELATPETYMTDPLTLRKPDTLTSDTVTVTGSGETAVEYPHDTKHYIDSQIAAAVALALGN